MRRCGSAGVTESAPCSTNVVTLRTLGAAIKTPHSPMASHLPRAATFPRMASHPSFKCHLCASYQQDLTRDPVGRNPCCDAGEGGAGSGAHGELSTDKLAPGGLEPLKWIMSRPCQNSPIPNIFTMKCNVCWCGCSALSPNREQDILYCSAWASLSSHPGMCTPLLPSLCSLELPLSPGRSAWSCRPVYLICASAMTGCFFLSA